MMEERNEPMCLAVPGKAGSLRQRPPGATGRVGFGGVVKEMSLAFAPEARVGDLVLVHVGFAIGVIDAAEAERTFTHLREIGDLGSSSELEGPP